MSSDNQFDFVIVGAGPAGCSIARGLAASVSKPSVCLVESGGQNDDVNQRINGNVYVQKMNPTQARLYESIPQTALGGRKVDLTRGQGLGGSTAVNFSAWTMAPRDDYNAIAKLTNDPSWRWENVQRRCKALETYHAKYPDIPAGMERYLNPKNEDHGNSGPLNIGFETDWDGYTTETLDIWAANGYEINPDMGSGSNLGISICPKSMHRGTRVTAADLLFPTPANLVIKTGANVHRVLIEGGRATGIVLVDGTQLKVRKEVIISAGSFDSPKILMHSGIGPAEQLAKFGIETVVNNQNVGKHAKDHYHIALKYARNEQSNTTAAFFRDPARQATALRQWQSYRTGEYANAGTGIAMGYFKSRGVLNSKEFNDLPQEEKARLQLPTVPTYEIAMLGISPEYYISPETALPLLQLLVFVHNSQYSGTMNLASADPTVPLDFDIGLMSHPYDRRVAIESTREALKVVRSPEFRKNEHPENPNFEVPADDSDEAIIDFWNKNCMSTWHTSGSCRMGQANDETAVVDTHFRVKGVKGLRVADLSVVPILASSHTQTVAYQVGLVAAEKIVAENRLNGGASL